MSISGSNPYRPGKQNKNGMVYMSEPSHELVCQGSHACRGGHFLLWSHALMGPKATASLCTQLQDDRFELQDSVALGRLYAARRYVIHP